MELVEATHGEMIMIIAKMRRMEEREAMMDKLDALLLLLYHEHEHEPYWVGLLWHL